MKLHHEAQPAAGTKKSIIKCLALLLVLFLLSSQSIWAASGDGKIKKYKMSHELRTLTVSGDIDVIIQFRKAPRGEQFRFLSAQGARVKGKFSHMNTVSVRISSLMLPLLEGNSDIVYVSPNRRLKRTFDETAPAVLADSVAQQFGYDGSGVGVAVIDSGVADHPDLHSASNPSQSRVVYSESFVSGDSSANDLYGHGTHVAGIIAGNGAASASGSGYARQHLGIAPGVNLVNLRVLDANGGGDDASVLAAIQRAIDLKDTYNIRVLNLSLGRPIGESYTQDPLCQAVEAAWRAGIVVVVAAGNNGRNNTLGNNGYASINSPANDPAVITVGATKENGTDTRLDDAIASYSSKGPSLIDHIAKPDIVAPGNHIVSLIASNSTLDRNAPQFEVSSAPVTTCDALNICTTQTGRAEYFMLSGTSMATPVVSGAVALLLQQNPALTPDQVKARLMKTAWKGLPQFSATVDAAGTVYNEQSDVFTVGAGYLDVQAALSNNDVAQGMALSPTAVRDSVTGTVTLTNTDASVWGTTVVWGANSGDANAAIWGTSVVWGAEVDANSVVWGNSVIWGADASASGGVDANSVIWGNIDAESVVWGIDAESVVWGLFGDGGDGGDGMLALSAASGDQ